VVDEPEPAARIPALAPANVQVAPVRTRADRDEFVSLPWRIYAHDPAWVPPLRREVERFIDPEHHPFYRHGAAAIFLARRNGEVAGRILVSDDPNYNREQGTNLGAFGLFECVDDSEVARALLHTAARWLRSRGRDSMLGPIEYSTNYTCGLLVDGFDTPPRLLMNHNPPYYEALLRGWGLAPVKDLYAWWIDDPPDLRPWLARAARIEDNGVRIRRLRKRDLAREIERASLVYHDAWAGNWGFVEMTDAELADLGRHLAEIADERLLLIAERDGEPVAFSMGLPDVNEALRGVRDGRLVRGGLPIGLVRLLIGMRRIRTFRYFTLGVRPAFRGHGIAEALMLSTVSTALGAGYRAAELGWTLEDNVRVNRIATRVGARPYKTYRIYEAALEDG